jgi:hypothetical protein
MNNLRKSALLLVASLLFVSVNAQEYKAHNYLGLQQSFGTLQNPYTNGNLDAFEEKFRVGVLEYATEGMDKNFFIRFKTDFFGVIPDYLIKAINKSNRSLIYGARMDGFLEEYNQIQTQYEFNASFSDWDVLGGNIAYGYKYLFVGGNFAWVNTTLKAYESVSNIKIKEQDPPDFHSFNSMGNFTYGLNAVLANNNPEKPIRLLVAYDWMLMRDYNRKWRSDLGTRTTVDLQANFPGLLRDGKWGIYGAASYRMHDITYPLSHDAVEYTQDFSSSIISFRAGISW